MYKINPNANQVQDYFQRLLSLMDLEAEAEKQENLRQIQQISPADAEASGNSLVNLVIREEESGLGGRILLTLGKRNQSLPLPWTRLSMGTPVLLTEENRAKNSDPLDSAWRGVVSRLQKDTVQVAFSTWPESENEHPSFRLDRSSDEIARQRQREALLRVQQEPSSTRLGTLRDVLLGRVPAAFTPVEPIRFYDCLLNEPQCQAVHFSLTCDDIAILHGPPGTGKTTTLVELIRQIVRSGQTVIACAPSNLAVDNLLEKLIAAGEHAIRIGHPARVLPELQDHTLDLLVENHPDMQVAQKLTREAHQLREKSFKFTRARPEPGAKQAMREEAQQMLDEARHIEDQLVERILDRAPILCATNTGLDNRLLGKRTYDWCVMDEASQTTEPAAWIPILRCKRVILGGDHFQLPPTVISQQAAAAGFNVSLLERLTSLPGSNFTRRLTVQYRMHQDIMAFSSREFYEDTLAADASVRGHLLTDLPGVIENELTNSPVHFIDTAGASYDETLEEDGESKFNPLEAELVVRMVQELLDSGVRETDIAVITPYAAQVRCLRDHLRHTAIEIDSVDGFQGREKEAVIVSLVRSNPDGDIGFLSDIRRTNVALTRARRKLILIGDSATIASHPFYQRLTAYMEDINAYHSVWEEVWSS